MFDSLFDVVEFIRTSGSWRVILQDSWSIILLVTALIWCGKPEKFAIIIWWIVSTANAYLFNFLEERGIMASTYWLGVNWAFLFGDVLLLIGFVALAVCANRQYLFWVAGLQVIAVLAHAVRANHEDISPFVYALMTVGAGWLQIMAMTVGQIAYIRRKRGVYPDWYWQVARPMAARPFS